MKLPVGYVMRISKDETEIRLLENMEESVKNAMATNDKIPENVIVPVVNDTVINVSESNLSKATNSQKWFNMLKRTIKCPYYYFGLILLLIAVVALCIKYGRPMQLKACN